MLVTQIIGFFGVCGMVLSLALIGEKPIVNSDGAFYVIVLECLLMQHLTSDMQLSHITRRKYSPLNNKLSMFVVLCCVVIQMSEGLDILRCVKGLIMFSLICQSHFIYCICNEISKICKIQVFKVKTRVTETLL